MVLLQIWYDVHLPFSSDASWSFTSLLHLGEIFLDLGFCDGGFSHCLCFDCGFFVLNLGQSETADTPTSGFDEPCTSSSLQVGFDIFLQRLPSNLGIFDLLGVDFSLLEHLDLVREKASSFGISCNTNFTGTEGNLLSQKVIVVTTELCCHLLICKFDLRL